MKYIIIIILICFITSCVHPNYYVKHNRYPNRATKPEKKELKNGQNKLLTLVLGGAAFYYVVMRNNKEKWWEER